VSSSSLLTEAKRF